MILLLLLLALPAQAYTLRYNSKAKPHEIPGILERLTVLTGLNFESKCADWKPAPTPATGYVCGSWMPLHGSVQVGGGKVTVEVFTLNQSDPRAVPVKLTADLKRKIGKAVTSAAPVPRTP